MNLFWAPLIGNITSVMCVTSNDSNSMNTPAIGPVQGATIISRDYRACIDAWCEYLGQHIYSEATIAPTGAHLWGYSDLADRRVTWLANGLNEPWLRIVESPNAELRKPLESYGWHALDINVQDLDQLYNDLKGSPFKILHPPEKLPVNNTVRAMPLQGPNNEILYMMQIESEVPTFNIPFARCFVDRIIVPVVSVPNRDSGLAFYEEYERTHGVKFDTKIKLISRELGLDSETAYAVAAVQLAGENMLEIDEIPGLKSATFNNLTPAAGIGAVSFEVDKLPKDCKKYTITYGPLVGQPVTLTYGAAGELIELIERRPKSN